jgi:predicted nucleic acid-binding protein
LIVVDASAALEVLLRGPRGAAVESLLFDLREDLAAPHLIDVEVIQVLRRLVRRGEVTPVRAEQALADLSDMPLQRYEHSWLASRIWSMRDNVTAYDACYLALAEVLGARLVTCDAALAGVPGCAAEVALIS